MMARSKISGDCLAEGTPGSTSVLATAMPLSQSSKASDDCSSPLRHSSVMRARRSVFSARSE